MSSENPAPTEEEINALLSVDAFKTKYNKVLVELDALHRGVFDDADAEGTAALCLISQAALINVQSTAELRARSLKRDMDFAKADAFAKLKLQLFDGKKPSDATVTNLVNKDSDVHQLYMEQIHAEKESNELKNILSLLKDAHFTFRVMVKRQ